MDKVEIISPGIASGKIFRLETGETQKNLQNKPVNSEEEIRKFQEAIKVCEIEIKELKEKTSKKLSSKEAKIFDAHLMFLQDPVLIDDTYRLITEKKVRSEEALSDKLKELEALFASIEDPLFKSRWADLEDVGKRLLRILAGKSVSLFPGERVIILTEEINPSQILSMADNLAGIITVSGSYNAHSSILARALKIPMAIRHDALNILKEGDSVILDCDCGRIILSPDEKELDIYKGKIKEINLQRITPAKPSPVETFTKDGVKITLLANIIHPGEADDVIRAGAEGVGIYRTEFSYLSKLPSEEELFLDYRAIAEKLNPLPVNVRTLDLGADKWPPYLPPLEEANPALGLRGIRFSLKNREIFETQLRAILRAWEYGNVAIILPMVSCLEDILNTKEIIKEVSEKIHINKEIPLGIMLETPSSVLTADLLAGETDFMSMGTNDLVQYTMAADRDFSGTEEWYQSLHPSLLRLYKMAAEAGEKHGIPVSICGEIGGNIEILPVLIGCGIKGFSMAPSKIESVREKIKGLSYTKLRDLAGEAVNCKSIFDVKKLLS